MDWKIILALAVLVMPMAYCEMDRQRQSTIEKVACFEQGGEWTRVWGGTCKFDG